MTREEVLKNIKTIFKDDIIEFFDKSQKRVYIEIKPEAIREVTRYIFSDLGARFNIASGIDTRTDIEILYHFTIEDLNLLISIRVKLPKLKIPQLNSIATVIKAADWIEREMHELLGINFKDHPDLRRLLLSEDWPQDVHPLRRDYKEWDDTAVRDRGI